MSVEKRCSCDEKRWTKCPHDAWYLQTFRWQGQAYEPNLTRYARVVLGRVITTKTDAEAVEDLVCAAIRAGTYVPVKAYRPAAAPPPVLLGQSLRRIADAFLVSFVDGDPEKRRNSKINDRAILKHLCAFRTDRGPLGDQPMAAVTIDTLIAFRKAQTHLAQSTWAKYRTLLGQCWRWARWAGHVETDLFATTPPEMLKLLRRKKAAQRHRRISDEEIVRLLEAAAESRYAQAATRLGALIVALLETGCRVGELLALQWRDVQLAARQVFIRAEEVGGAKTDEGRMIELSQCLLELLPTLRRDPAGQELPRTAYVFGTEYGERVRSIDKAWQTAVLKAHGHTPIWTGKGKLAPASRAALQGIDLHLHDLRHEAGCRLLESGWFDLAQIQRRYGHASLAQTAGYLHATAGSMRQAQQDYDRARGADPAAIPAPSADKLRTKGRPAALSVVPPRRENGRKVKGDTRL